ncbi:hypothetical protein BJX70DRAFT_405980 [Aspergillus crustosus]
MPRLPFFAILCLLGPLFLIHILGSPVTRQTNRVPLRILPLGASITFGVHSYDNNGYRKPLRDYLRYNDWEVNMAGSKSGGTMTDNDVEARLGDTINMARAAAINSIPYKPNVVLINAGTNDCRLATDADIPNAVDQMRTLIDTLRDGPDMKETVIILSTLIPSDNPLIERHRELVNDQYRELVRLMRDEGVPILLADMDPYVHTVADRWLKFPDDYTTNGKVDDTHPSISGYRKMAYVWAEAIERAHSEDPIAQPVAVDVGGGQVREKEFGNGIYAGGPHTKGQCEAQGVVFSYQAEKNVEEDDGDTQFFFARLASRERDDLLVFHRDTEGTVTHEVYWNDGGRIQTGGTLSTKDNCNARGVHFRDINGDGLDDFICIALDGTAYASVNNGHGNGGGQPPTFTHIGKWKHSEGSEQANIRLADIDGDGRADYWKGMGDLIGVRFEDINGDGRDDWLWVDDDGKTFTYTNSWSCIKGRRVHFARVFGEVQDFGLLGRQDYVFFDKKMPDDDSNFGPLYEMHVWKNVGFGATKIKADGNRYCNLMGHSNGLITVSDDGESYWGLSSYIWDPSQMEINKPLDRRDLHLINWDGDGACDIEYISNPAPSLYRPQRRGLGFSNQPVQLADISGNGEADYLCVEPDGRTWGFLQSNDNSGWEHIDQFKFAEGKDRANLHWADVNGDGQADLIHTNKFNGDSTVWYNRGRKNIGGSRFHWDPDGVKYQGAVAGSCTYFPDLNGDGRADMHSIIHSTINRVETWYNGCAGKDRTGDDGALTDPALPVLEEMICYTNNTVNWWWGQSWITCCDPFFNLNTIEETYENEKRNAPDDLDLNYMQTSGNILLHEMLHTKAVTGIDHYNKFQPLPALPSGSASSTRREKALKQTG